MRGKNGRFVKLDTTPKQYVPKKVTRFEYEDEYEDEASWVSLIILSIIAGLCIGYIIHFLK